MASVADDFRLRIRAETHAKLAERKVHPRQSFDEVIQNLLAQEANK